MLRHAIQPPQVLDTLFEVTLLYLPEVIAQDVVGVKRVHLGQGSVRGGRHAGQLVLGARGRNVARLQDMRSDDLKLSDDILDRTGRGEVAAVTEGNHPLNVCDGVVARGALDHVACKRLSLRLRLGLFSIFCCVIWEMDPSEAGIGLQPRRDRHP